MVRLKDNKTHHFQLSANSFQFLMVRLKEEFYKSQMLKFIQFQFLMVRLKDINDYKIVSFKSYFNSLWCD